MDVDIETHDCTKKIDQDKYKFEIAYWHSVRSDKI